MFKKNQKGFTIIEVLIVLAIAGLIILIVFLAVPALQRNSRNTRYKDAAAAILATVNEYVTNNNGGMPTAGSIAADGTISITGTGTTATGRTEGGYTIIAAAPTTGNAGQFYLAFNRKCNGNTINTASTINRAVAVQYEVETASSTTPQCTES